MPHAVQSAAVEQQLSNPAEGSPWSGRFDKNPDSTPHVPLAAGGGAEGVCPAEQDQVRGCREWARVASKKGAEGMGASAQLSSGPSSLHSSCWGLHSVEQVSSKQGTTATSMPTSQPHS